MIYLTNSRFLLYYIIFIEDIPKVINNRVVDYDHVSNVRVVKYHKVSIDRMRHDIYLVKYYTKGTGFVKIHLTIDSSGDMEYVHIVEATDLRMYQRGDNNFENVVSSILKLLLRISPNGDILRELGRFIEMDMRM